MASDPREIPMGWPVLLPEALSGTPGWIVSGISPETESDPAALLFSLLTAFGVAVGPCPHAEAEGAEHPGRLFIAVVGDTARSRKGSSWKRVEQIMKVALPDFFPERVKSGFGSGEVFVDTVNELPDQCMLVLETELSRLLTVGNRRDSVLMQIVRDAWDGTRLEARSRLHTSTAENPHVAIVGHVTQSELENKLNSFEIANGFANRFLFVCSRRSKELPSGGHLDAGFINAAANAIRAAHEHSQTVALMSRSPAAEQLWDPLYREMIADAPSGLLGSVIARDAPYVLRLSVLYALLDLKSTIEETHLRSAHAAWKYCRASAEYLWPPGMLDPKADRILQDLEVAGTVGLTLTELRRGCSNHFQPKELPSILNSLERDHLIVRRREFTRGRPRDIIIAVSCLEPRGDGRS
jgi:hypothetical protein